MMMMMIPYVAMSRVHAQTRAGALSLRELENDELERRVILLDTFVRTVMFIIATFDGPSYVTVNSPHSESFANRKPIYTPRIGHFQGLPTDLHFRGHAVSVAPKDTQGDDLSHAPPPTLRGGEEGFIIFY